jgi:hypothetical protein
MPVQPYKIYALLHPVTKKPFYIGSTQKLLIQRLAGHITASEKPKSKLSIFINDLVGQGLTPKIKLLETTDKYWREAELIQRYSKRHELCNVILCKWLTKDKLKQLRKS